jgi:hypothetical protein
MSVMLLATRLAAPWAHLYQDSKLASTAVTFAHIGGLLLGGGFAITADRMTLRSLRKDPDYRQAHLEELHAIHRPVLLGLGVTLVSGLLMLAADLQTFILAPLFWAKLGIVAALLLNGAILRHSETALRKGTARPERFWNWLRRTAWASVGLWFGSVLLGTALLAV